MPFSGPIRRVVTYKKSLLSMFFAVFININIFKCIQIALNTLFFPIHHSCKEKESVKQRNRPISGPILSDPVIRPNPVNTRTPSLPYLFAC